jgi:hypothetical protein
MGMGGTATAIGMGGAKHNVSPANCGQKLIEACADVRPMPALKCRANWELHATVCTASRRFLPLCGREGPRTRGT